MIAIRKLSILLWAILFVTLAACGDDDDPAPAGGGGGGGGTGPQAVELEQLAGTWFGTFDNEDIVRTFGFDIAGSEITNATLDGDPLPLQGSILERADEIGEGSRVFRFEATVGAANPRGVLILDPSATYMVYVYSNGQFGVLQKGATEMPADGFTADAVAGSWEGITVAAPTVVDEDAALSPVQQANSSATCTTDTSVDPATSQCDITIADATKTASALTLAVPELGQWTGTYDADGTARILLSADGNFSGVWGCTGLPDGFPENCDFSAWNKGQAGTEEPTGEQPEETAPEQGA